MKHTWFLILGSFGTYLGCVSGDTDMLLLPDFVSGPHLAQLNNTWIQQLQMIQKVYPSCTIL